MKSWSELNRGAKIGLVLGGILALVLGIFLLTPDYQEMGVTNLSSLHLSDTGETATPVLLVNQDGAGKVVEFQDGGTPVWSLTNGGSVEQSGGQTYSNWLRVAAPTAIATATPAVVVDSAGVSNILEVRDGATPVWYVSNGGTWVSTGEGTHSGGQTVNNWSEVAAPTAIATATPALVVDSAGVSNILEVRDGATPVWYVSNGGDLVAVGASDLQGNLGDSGGTLTVADDLMVDGAADATQLTVQGHTTQTNDTLVVEQSDGTDVFTVDDSGNIVVVGTGDLQGNLSDSGGTLTVADNLMVDGAADAAQLTVQGHTTQTNNILVVEQSDGTDKFYITDDGQVTIAGVPDSDDQNYDHVLTISYEMSGTGTKDRTYGLLIEGTRAAGQELISGDHDEAGLKIRVDTEATRTTAGTVLRGADIEAKADNPDGEVYNLYGAAITAKSDTGAGEVSEMIALQTNVQNNATVTTTLISADFRNMRQAATEPTSEYVVRVRNSSTSGSGADAGIYLSSDYGSSATTDSFDYGIDFSGAALNTAEIKGENGETIDNGTDTAWTIGGFTSFEEASVIDLSADFTITATTTYQPLTVSGAGTITSSATTAIADGPTAGALLILVNEDDQDIVLQDGANILAGGNITLTANADDAAVFIWDGADWVMLAFHDN